jgi:hypothetical protein
MGRLSASVSFGLQVARKIILCLMQMLSEDYMRWLMRLCVLASSKYELTVPKLPQSLAGHLPSCRQSHILPSLCPKLQSQCSWCFWSRIWLSLQFPFLLRCWSIYLQPHSCPLPTGCPHPGLSKPSFFDPIPIHHLSFTPTGSQLLEGGARTAFLSNWERTGRHLIPSYPRRLWFTVGMGALNTHTHQ